jgi:hypothetical protein
MQAGRLCLWPFNLYTFDIRILFSHFLRAVIECQASHLAGTLALIERDVQIKNRVPEFRAVSGSFWRRPGSGGQPPGVCLTILAFFFLAIISQ